MAWVYTIALIIVGFVLVAIEIFVIPGINLVGFAGGLAILYGLYYAFVHLGPQAAGLCLFASLLLGGILLRILLKTRSWHRLILDSKEDTKEGFRSTDPHLESLLGKSGTALSPLRPAGIALIEGEKVDVVTEGTLIPRDARIQVIEVEGNRVVVRQV